MSKVYTSIIENYSESSLIHDFLKNFFSKHIDKLSLSKKILLKPNLLGAFKPERCVTTNPIVLEQVIKTVKSFTNAKLFLGDSPGSAFGGYHKVLQITGIYDICTKYDVEIVMVEDYKVKKDSPISSIVDDFELIINIPKLKTHGMVGVTGGVKNLYGLIPGEFKVMYHKQNPNSYNLAKFIYGFYKKEFLNSNKVLTVLDGIDGMQGAGPASGTPYSYRLMAASDDAVALDIVVTKAMNLKTEFCLTSKAALEMAYNQDNIQIQGNLPKIGDFQKPVVWHNKSFYDKYKKLLAGLIYAKPIMNTKKCLKNCQKCLSKCPTEAIIKDDINSSLYIDYKKCIKCSVCYDICPEQGDAMFMKRSYLHKKMIRENRK